VEERGGQEIEKIWARDKWPPKPKAGDLTKVLYAGSLLRIDLNKSEQPIQLTNIDAVVCLLAARLGAPHRSVGLRLTAKATEGASARALAEELVQQRFKEINLPARSASGAAITEPMLIDVVCGVYGGTTLREAAYSLVQKVLNVVLTGTPQQRWTAFAVAAMAFLGTSDHDAAFSDDDFVRLLQKAVGPYLAKAPSGLVPISEAYRLFELQGPRMELEEFKNRVVAATRDQKVELTPLSVASLLPSEVRRLSETLLGGRAFHFLRPVNVR
jgi:hypothetical protein